MGHTTTMVLNQSEMFRDGNNDIGYFNTIKVLYNLLHLQSAYNVC